MMARDAGEHGPPPDDRRAAPSTIRYVKDMLSIMFTCGMYDYSGSGRIASAFPPRAASAAG